MLLRSGALEVYCHPEGASATEGSPQRIRGDPSPRVTRFSDDIEARVYSRSTLEGTEESRGLRRTFAALRIPLEH